MSLVRPYALPVWKGKDSLIEINLDVLHAMQDSIRMSRLNHIVTSEFLQIMTFIFKSNLILFPFFHAGAFLESTSPPVTGHSANCALAGNINPMRGGLIA